MTKLLYSIIAKKHVRFTRVFLLAAKKLKESGIFFIKKINKICIFCDKSIAF